MLLETCVRVIAHLKLGLTLFLQQRNNMLDLLGLSGCERAFI
jgi:hypothetical protein